MDKELEFIELLKRSQRIVYFGGAGTSTESNIPDFRSQDGLYALRYKYPPEKMLSRSFFYEETELFFNFYRDKVLYPDALPNKAHYALTELEKMGKLKGIVTQNIDGLHQLSGSQKVIELHGSVHQNYCVDCQKTYSLDYVIQSSTSIPKCQACGGIVRPDVVLYEEGLNQGVMKEAIDLIASSDMLIVGGTSLVVYPAAGLIRHHNQDRLILINKSETKYDKRARLRFDESIGALLDRVICHL